MLHSSGFPLPVMVFKLKLIEVKLVLSYACNI